MEINVITKPIYIEFDCPHCKKVVKFNFEEFVGVVGEPVDWLQSKFSCPECWTEIEIDNVEWL